MRQQLLLQASPSLLRAARALQEHYLLTSCDVLRTKSDSGGMCEKVHSLMRDTVRKLLHDSSRKPGILLPASQEGPMS